MFRIGMKVVCVEGVAEFKTGSIYTVGAFLECSCKDKYICIKEFASNYGFTCAKCRKKHPTMGYAGAYSWRFRPLEDWELEDISELTEVIKNPRLTPTTYQIID